MKNLITSAFVIVLFAGASFAQGKSNAVIAEQIASLRASKNITLTADAGGGSSKVMAIAENFSQRDADEIGVQAMNFAAGFFYSGTALTSAPDTIKLTFWVLSKKPRFAEDHSLRFLAGDETIDAAPGRYAAKPRENMEYLNFEIARTDLAKVAVRSEATVYLGGHRFSFTRGQLKMLADLLVIAEVPK